MSSKDIALPLAGQESGIPWERWVRQVLSIMRLETRRNFFTTRGLWVYLLAFAPVCIIAAHAFLEPILSGRPLDCNREEDSNILAGIFELYYLRLGIFFGCMGIFTRLFRGEIVEKSLHYYFLSPVRRESLVIGKFLAGLISAIFIFGVAVFLACAIMWGHFGAAGREFVFQGPGLGHLGSYLGVTVLACIGYGSVFLLMGLLFNNPIIPAVVILLWETINSVLPSMLKKLSIIFYLKPLCPVEVPIEGLIQLFSVTADPMPAYVAIPGLLIMSMLLLAASCYRIRRMEINYTAE